MKGALPYLLSTVLLFAVFTTGCERSRSQTTSSADSAEVHAKGKGDYELGVWLIDFAGRYTLTINGFPVSRLPVMGRTAGQTVGTSVQTALIGEGNTAGMETEPYVQYTGERLSFGPVRFSARVQGPEGKPLAGTEITRAQVDSAYAAWKRRAQEQWSGYVHRKGQGGDGWAADSLRQWIRRHPMTVFTTFDNEAGPDFSAIFEEAPALEGTPQDTSRLVDYALKLKNLLREGDAEALYDEIQPSVDEEIGWYQVAYAGKGRENAIPYIRDEWNWNTDFERSDIGVRRWSSGRVWELYVKPGEPLFHSARSHLNVYVANIGGKLKVVRLNA